MKKGGAWLLALILLLGLLPLGAAGAEEVTYTGTVTGGSLHMRQSPSADAKVVATYKSGAEVEILENDGTWCKVQKGNKTGYMMTQYLTIKANYPHLGWGMTKDDGTVLNLRAKAEGDSAILLKCMSGVALELVEESGEWYRARIGTTFGYVERSRVTKITGDFVLGLQGSGAADGLTAANLSAAPKETGNPKSITRDEGTFTYTLNSPELAVAAANAAIDQWLEDTLSVFRADHAANHAGEKASYTVQYQALAPNDRYQSVLLLGEYQTGALTCQTVLAVNVDTQTGEVLSEKQIFEDASRALFSLESRVSAMLGQPADGYDGKPDAAWLKYAVLTKSGLDVYLPAGLHLPLSLGTRKITLPFAEVAEATRLDSSLISGFVRVIDPTKPMIALTFDDGPSEETERILAVLAQYNARATFCVLGNKVETYGDIIKQAIAQGNEIACHTWNHKKLTELSAANIRSQITRTTEAVREVTGGYEIKVLRPPYGSVNKNVRNICAELDIVIAHWKVDTLDWDTRSTSKTYRAILNGAKNGAIILCHDLYSSTASAVEKAVPELVEKGIQLVTVSELLSFHKDGAQAGTVYAYLDPDNIVTGQ